MLLIMFGALASGSPCGPGTSAASSSSGRENLDQTRRLRPVDWHPADCFFRRESRRPSRQHGHTAADWPKAALTRTIEEDQIGRTMSVKVKEWKGAWWVFINHHGSRKAKRIGVGAAGKKAAQHVAE